MAERYRHKQLDVDKNGKPFLRTTINPTIPVDSSDIVIIAKVGDRLDILAQKHYGKSSYWWIIAEANGVGKGSLFVTPGTSLRIPRNVSKIMERQDKISRSR